LLYDQSQNHHQSTCYILDSIILVQPSINVLKAQLKKNLLPCCFVNKHHPTILKSPTILQVETNRYGSTCVYNIVF